MTKKRDRERGTGRDVSRKASKPAQTKALSRRDFFKSGAAAGAGAAVLSGSGQALAQAPSSGAQGIQWNYEADVVVLGSGCMGLHAAIRARDLGASGAPDEPLRERQVRSDLFFADELNIEGSRRRRAVRCVDSENRRPPALLVERVGRSGGRG